MCCPQKGGTSTLTLCWLEIWTNWGEWDWVKQKTPPPCHRKHEHRRTACSFQTGKRVWRVLQSFSMSDSDEDVCTDAEHWEYPSKRRGQGEGGSQPRIGPIFLPPTPQGHAQHGKQNAKQAGLQHWAEWNSGGERSRCAGGRGEGGVGGCCPQWLVSHLMTPQAMSSGRIRTRENTATAVPGAFCGH